ncbi:MAG: DUF3137 domain-containing protein [Candidatus Woesearchaeota archaeon]
MQNKWDPTGAKLDIKKFEKNLEEIFKKERFHKKHFYKILVGTILLTVVISVLLTLYDGSGNLAEVYFMAVITPIIVVIFFIGSLRNLKKGLMKAKLAKEKGWVFEPKENSSLYSFYLGSFPKLFNMGNCFRSLQNVIWGKTNNGVPFVVGDFNYAVRRSSGKRTTTTRYTDHFFAVKLNTPLSTNFYLGPKNMGSKLKNLFTKKNIQTESIDFNERFYFCYENKDSETQMNIMNVLSPGVLEQLASFGLKKRKRFKSQSGGVKVYFKGDSIIFLAPGPFFEKTGISLTPKSLDITKEDRAELDSQINYYFNLGQNIVENIH